MVRAVREQAAREGLKLGMVLIDLTKAYDSVHHGILCQRLVEAGVPAAFVRVAMSYVTANVLRIDFGSVAGEHERASRLPFAVGRGVPQGSILSPWYFKRVH